MKIEGIFQTCLFEIITHEYKNRETYNAMWKKENEWKLWDAFIFKM